MYICIYIVSASRSPPGQDPKRCHFGTHFYHFWSPFGGTCAIWGPLLEHFWVHVSNNGATGAPRGATPPNPLTHLDTFGRSFFKHFCTFDEKTAYLKHICFFCDFFVASSAFRDGLTCNPYAPAQSKRTFSFSHVFWKLGPARPHLGSIWHHFWVRIEPSWPKKGFQKLFWKVLPPKSQKAHYWQVPGPLDSHPYFKDFSNKKQQSEQETRTAAQIQIAIAIQFTFSWSDTPWAKARRIYACSSFGVMFDYGVRFS